MIGLFAQNYHIGPETVLEYTLANVSMYNAIIPLPSDKEEVIDADDPLNANYVNKILGF